MRASTAPASSRSTAGLEGTCFAPGRRARRRSTPTSRTTPSWLRRCSALRGDFEVRWYVAARDARRPDDRALRRRRARRVLHHLGRHDAPVARRKDVDDTRSRPATRPPPRPAAAGRAHRRGPLRGVGGRYDAPLRPDRARHPLAFGHLLQAIDLHLAPRARGRAGRPRSAPTGALASWRGPARPHRAARDRAGGTEGTGARAAARPPHGRGQARPPTSASTSPASAGDRAERARAPLALARGPAGTARSPRE